MKRAELASLIRKTASASRASARLALLRKSAYYSAEALPKGSRSYGSLLYPVNRTVADAIALTLPKAVRAQQHAQAGGVMEALGFRPAKPAARPQPGPRAGSAPAKAAPAKAEPVTRAHLDQIGTNILLGGRNLVTNPIDTLRRHFNGQPLKR